MSGITIVVLITHYGIFDTTIVAYDYELKM